MLTTQDAEIKWVDNTVSPPKTLAKELSEQLQVYLRDEQITKSESHIVTIYNIITELEKLSPATKWTKLRATDQKCSQLITLISCIDYSIRDNAPGADYSIKQNASKKFFSTITMLQKQLTGPGDFNTKFNNLKRHHSVEQPIVESDERRAVQLKTGGYAISKIKFPETREEFLLLVKILQNAIIKHINLYKKASPDILSNVHSFRHSLDTFLTQLSAVESIDLTKHRVTLAKLIADAMDPQTNFGKSLQALTNFTKQDLNALMLTNIDFVYLKKQVFAALDTYQTTVESGKEKKYIAWRLWDAVNEFHTLTDDAQKKKFITILYAIVFEDDSHVRNRLGDAISDVIADHCISTSLAKQDDKKAEAKRVLTVLKNGYHITDAEIQKQQSGFKAPSVEDLLHINPFTSQTEQTFQDTNAFNAVKEKLIRAADNYLARHSKHSQIQNTLTVTQAKNFKDALARLTFIDNKRDVSWTELLELLYLFALTQQNLGILDDKDLGDEVLAALNLDNTQQILKIRFGSLRTSECDISRDILYQSCRHFSPLNVEHAKFIFNMPISKETAQATQEEMPSAQPADREVGGATANAATAQQAASQWGADKQKNMRLQTALKDAAEELLAEEGHSDIDMIWACNLLDMLKDGASLQYKTTLALASAVICGSSEGEKAHQLIEKLEKAGINKEKLVQLRRDANVFRATPFVKIANALQRKIQMSPNTWNDFATKAWNAAHAYRSAGLGKADEKLRVENFIRGLEKITTCNNGNGSTQRKCEVPCGSAHDTQLRDIYLILLALVYATVFKTSSGAFKNGLLDFLSTIKPHGLDENDLEALYNQFLHHDTTLTTLVNAAKETLEQKSQNCTQIDFTILQADFKRAMEYCAKNADKPADRALAQNILNALTPSANNASSTHAEGDSANASSTELSSSRLQTVQEFSNALTSEHQPVDKVTSPLDRIITLMQIAASKSKYLREEIEACIGRDPNKLQPTKDCDKNLRSSLESQILTSSAQSATAQPTQPNLEKIKTAIDGYLREMMSKTGFAKTWDEIAHKEGRRRALILYRALDKIKLPGDQQSLVKLLRGIRDSGSKNLLNRILLHTGLSAHELDDHLRTGATPATAVASANGDDDNDMLSPSITASTGGSEITDTFIDAVFTALDVYQIHNYGGKEGKLRAARLRQELEKLFPLTQVANLDDLEAASNIYRKQWILLTALEKAAVQNLLCALVVKSGADNLKKNILQATGWEESDFKKLQNQTGATDADLIKLANNLKEIAPSQTQSTTLSQHITHDASILKTTLTEVANRYLERPSQFRERIVETKIRNFIAALNEINAPFDLDKMCELIQLATLFTDFAKTGIEDDLNAALRVNFGVENVKQYFEQHYPQLTHATENDAKEILEDIFYYSEDDEVVAADRKRLNPQRPRNDSAADVAAVNEGEINNSIPMVLTALQDNEKTCALGLQALLSRNPSASQEEKITAYCAIVFHTQHDALKKIILEKLNLTTLGLKKLQRQNKISNNAVRYKALELAENPKVLDWAKLKTQTSDIIEKYIHTNLAKHWEDRALLYHILFILKNSSDSVSFYQKYILISFLNSVVNSAATKNSFPELKALVLENVMSTLFQAEAGVTSPSLLHAFGNLATVYQCPDITSIKLPDTYVDFQLLKQMLTTAADYSIALNKDTQSAAEIATRYKECLDKDQNGDEVIALILWRQWQLPGIAFQYSVVPFDISIGRHNTWIAEKSEVMTAAQKALTSTQQPANTSALFHTQNRRNQEMMEWSVASVASLQPPAAPILAYNDTWTSALHDGMTKAIDHYLKDAQKVDPKEMTEGRRRAENIKAALSKISVQPPAPVSNETKKQLALLICAAVLHKPHIGPGSQTLRAKILFHTGMNVMQLEALQEQFKIRYACELLSSRLIDGKYLESESLLDPTGNWGQFWVEKKGIISGEITRLLSAGKKGTDTYTRLNNLNTLLNGINNTDDNANRQIAQVILAFSTIAGLDKVRAIIFHDTTKCTREDFEYLRVLHFDIDFLAAQAKEFQKENPQILSEADFIKPPSSQLAESYNYQPI